jgi:CHAT domain-containing protein/tetratricopeptide (TPR) repeat protein
MGSPRPLDTPFETALHDLVNTATPLARAEALQRHGALVLSDGAEEVLEDNADRLRSAGDLAGAGIFDHVLSVIRMARAQGVDAAITSLHSEERWRRVGDLVNAAWSYMPAVLAGNQVLVHPETLRMLADARDRNSGDALASQQLRLATALVERALEHGVETVAAWLRDQMFGNVAKAIRNGDQELTSSLIGTIRELTPPEEFAEIHRRLVRLFLDLLPAEHAVQAIESLLATTDYTDVEHADRYLLNVDVAIELLKDPTDVHAMAAIRLLGNAIPEMAAAGYTFHGLYGTLGRAHLLRQSGHRAENCQIARRHLETELRIAEDDADAKSLLVTHRLLCEACSGMGDAGAALTHLEAALDIQAPMSDREAAQARLDLAQFRRKLHRADGESAIQTALADVLLVIQQAEPSSELWARANADAAHLLRERQRGDRSDDFRRAFQHLENALSVFRRDTDPNEWAKRQHDLGLLYLFDVRGDRAANIESALASFDKALEIHTRKDYRSYFGLTCTASGLAFIERVAGIRSENLRNAQNRLEAGAEALDREWDEEWWAECHSALGAVLMESGGPGVENLHKAVACFEAARKCYVELGNAQRVRQMDNGVAVALMELAPSEARAAERAVARLETIAAESSRDREPFLWAMFQRNLAAALMANAKISSQTRQRARAHLKSALDVLTPDVYPSEAHRTLTYLASLSFEEKDWETALVYYKQSIRVGELLLASSYTEPGRLRAVRDTTLEYARAAYCLRKLDRFDEALMTGEESRARLMAEAVASATMERKDVPPQLAQRLTEQRITVRALEGRMRHAVETGDAAAAGIAGELKTAREQIAATYQELRQSVPAFGRRFATTSEVLKAIPANGALVMFVMTSHGSFALVVKSSTKRLSFENVVDIEGIGTKWIHDLLDETRRESWTSLLRAATQLETPHQFQAWFQAMDDVAALLWTSCMRPVHERLMEIGVRPESEVVLLPQGGLWHLPLHAACRVAGASRRAFADDYQVAYAPSVFVFRTSADRMEGANAAPASLLAIVNPSEDLAYADREAKLIASRFEASERIRHGDARRRRVLEAAETASYLHFSCHGTYDWVNVMHSGLELAAGDRLTLDDMLSSLTLERCRLVTISACETGLTDVKGAPEEYLGIPAGFLIGGAAGVISSLWKVEDGATCLLMTKFYEHHLAGRRSPARSLKDAQQWLRSLTMDDLQQFSGEFENLYARYQALFPATGPDFLPFDSAFFWAAFVLTGV